MSPQKERIRTSVRWPVAIALLVLGLGAGWTTARGTRSVDASLTTGSSETAAVERRDIGATVLATGVVRPRVGAQVVVGSRASGVLRRLHVTVGDRAEAGQLLAQLDPIEFETQVERAEAMRLNAVAERTFAEGELARTEQLIAREVAAAVDLAAARRAVETSRAKEREANAALEAARVQLSYTSIRAPISGVVASVSTQEGETVAASFAAPTFVTIVDLSRLEVWAYVDETDIGRVEPGQRVRFTVDTYPDETFDGRVTAVRPTAELRDNVVNYVTLIDIETRSDVTLRPEMTTTVNIVIDGRNDALAVPNGALRRDANGPYVLVPAAAGVERRNVVVGFRGADFTELLSGMTAGERVVVGSTVPCTTETAEQRSR